MAKEQANDPSGKQLLAFIQRIENVNEEIADLTEDRKEIYAEAKGTGFDTKIVRMIVKRRKQDAAERAEQEALLDLYEHSIGMHPGEGDDE